jgi:hypothetical protein
MVELKLVSGETLKLVIEGAREVVRDAKPVADRPDRIEATQISHLFAVLGMLRPEETATACEVLAGFTGLELRAWLAELMKLSALQAVQHVRVLIAGNTEAVS